MSNENSFDNSDNKKLTEKPFQKGWQNFIDGMKDGFDKFKNSLEEQTKKNAELWEENTERKMKKRFFYLIIWKKIQWKNITISYRRSYSTFKTGLTVGGYFAPP